MGLEYVPTIEDVLLYEDIEKNIKTKQSKPQLRHLLLVLLQSLQNRQNLQSLLLKFKKSEISFSVVLVAAYCHVGFEVGVAGSLPPLVLKMELLFPLLICRFLLLPMLFICYFEYFHLV